MKSWLRGQRAPVLILLALCLAPTARADFVFPGTDVTIHEERGIESGEYLVPNEPDPQALSEVARGRGGVLVSIGTFRVPLTAAMGEFSRAVAIDYDRAATALNNVNFAQATTYANRHEYLADLLGRVAPELVAQAREGKLSDAEFLKLIYKMKPEKGAAGPGGFTAKATRATGWDWAQSYRPQIYQLLEEMAAVPERWQNSIFGSDRHFERFQRLARENRLVAVNTNIASTERLAELGSALRAAGETVSLIDLSNALDHVLGNGYSAIKVVEALAQLPLAEDTRVVLTMQEHSARGQPFDYYVMRLRTLNEASAKGYLKDLGTYVKFLRELKRTGVAGEGLDRVRHTEPVGFELPDLPPPVGFFKWCRQLLLGH